MVQRLCTPRDSTICVIEPEDEVDLVRNGKGGVAAEKVTDSDICRAPYRFAGFLKQSLVEKHRGSLVGEDHCDVGKLVLGVFGKQIFCYVLEKCHNKLSFYFYDVVVSNIP